AAALRDPRAELVTDRRRLDEAVQPAHPVRGGVVLLRRRVVDRRLEECAGLGLHGAVSARLAGDVVERACGAELAAEGVLHLRDLPVGLRGVEARLHLLRGYGGEPLKALAEVAGELLPERLLPSRFEVRNVGAPRDL